LKLSELDFSCFLLFYRPNRRKGSFEGSGRRILQKNLALRETFALFRLSYGTTQSKAISYAKLILNENEHSLPQSQVADGMARSFGQIQGLSCIAALKH
jgi:bisphosphoglycerate-dependent phosphoglycerate mutase